MKTTRLSGFTAMLLAGLLFIAGAHRLRAQQANNKPSGPAGNKPEALGFSSERLERLHVVMQQEVDQKHHKAHWLKEAQHVRSLQDAKAEIDTAVALIIGGGGSETLFGE